MGFLRKITRLFGARAAIRQLPAGTLTVDRHGRIVISTVSSAYSSSLLTEIGEDVAKVFREARVAQLPLTEVNLHFGSLLITARDLQGSTLIFLQPQSALSQPPN